MSVATRAAQPVTTGPRPGTTRALARRDSGPGQRWQQLKLNSSWREAACEACGGQHLVAALGTDGGICLGALAVFDEHCFPISGRT